MSLHFTEVLSHWRRIFEVDGDSATNHRLRRQCGRSISRLSCSVYELYDWGKVPELYGTL